MIAVSSHRRRATPPGWVPGFTRRTTFTEKIASAMVYGFNKSYACRRSLYCEDGAIWSYGPHFMAATIVQSAGGGRAILVNGDRSSVTTTRYVSTLRSIFQDRDSAYREVFNPEDLPVFTVSFSALYQAVSNLQGSTISRRFLDTQGTRTLHNAIREGHLTLLDARPDAYAKSPDAYEWIPGEVADTEPSPLDGWTVTRHENRSWSAHRPACALFRYKRIIPAVYTDGPYSVTTAEIGFDPNRPVSSDNPVVGVCCSVFGASDRQIRAWFRTRHVSGPDIAAAVAEATSRLKEQANHFIAEKIEPWSKSRDIDVRLLASMDEGSYFVSQMRGRPRTCDAAIASFRPKSLRSKPCFRQGEWYFVPVPPESVGLTKPVTLPRLDRWAARNNLVRCAALPRPGSQFRHANGIGYGSGDNGLGNFHAATRVWATRSGKTLYVFGIVRHFDAFGRTRRRRHHRNLDLRRVGLCKAVRNTSPASWSSTAVGGVD